MFQPRTLIRVMMVGCLLLAISAPLGAIAPQIGDHGPEMDPNGLTSNLTVSTDHGPAMDPNGVPRSMGYSLDADHGPAMDPNGLN